MVWIPEISYTLVQHKNLINYKKDLSNENNRKTTLG